jgi:hypothetical protein
MNFMQNP